MRRILRNSGDYTYEDRLNKEMLLSERFRALILAATIGIILTAIFIFSIIFRNDFKRIFQGQDVLFWAILILCILIFRELNIRLIIDRTLRSGRKIPQAVRYVNSFIEISFPSLAIIIFAQSVSYLSLASPVVLLYFIFIILSTLELDFKLCAFTGSVAAAEYIIISFIYLNTSDLSDSNNLLFIPAFYLARGFIIFLAGLVAGLVAIQIKKRIIHLHQTLEERNQLERLFGQQVSREIVDEIIKSKTELESKRRNVCIMFLDVRDFSKYCSGKDPEEIVKYQNDLFSVMIEIVNKHHGIINQFLGDGFMATFGAPISYRNDCLNAVAAALEIVDRIKQKNGSMEIPFTKIGIGIHTGEAVTGNVGTTIRKQYSITGGVVILASRIEQLNKEYNTQILITKEVFNKIDEEKIPCELVDQVNVKGIDDPIEIYKLA